MDNQITSTDICFICKRHGKRLSRMTLFKLTVWTKYLVHLLDTPEAIRQPHHLDE